MRYLATLLFACAWVMGVPPFVTAQGTNPFDGDPGAVRAGRQLFSARCAECHGADANWWGDLGLVPTGLTGNSPWSPPYILPERPRAPPAGTSRPSAGEFYGYPRAVLLFLRPRWAKRLQHLSGHRPSVKALPAPVQAATHDDGVV